MDKHDTLTECLNFKLENYLQSANISESGSLHKVCMQEVEKLLLTRVLDFTRHNHSKAAKILGITRTTLKKKVTLYQLDNNTL